MRGVRRRGQRAPSHSAAHSVPCGNLAGVQIRRLTAAAVAGLALIGLAGCRTAPNVAAYVGDNQVTVAELESAVDERLANPAIEKSAGDDRQAYTRQVLTALVQDEVHTIAAERYGVEVTDADVQDRVDQLIGDQDPDTVFAGLAERGISRPDAIASVRQQLIRMEIAEKQGLDDALSESALRDRYEKARTDSTDIQLGYITVPNAGIAEQVVAALEKNPDRYAELAQRYSGQFTLPAVEARSPDQIPGPLAEQAAAAEPGTAFAVPVAETGGVVVAFVGDFPSFEDMRAQLEQDASAEVDKEATAVVDQVRDDLDVVVNPRFGDLEDGQVQPADSGVVDILTEG